MYARTRSPSRKASSVTCRMSSIDSSIEELMFRRLKVSLAAVKTAIERTPAESARRRPFSFGTSVV
jgi:hypothetical protein